ncbi:BMP family ABC transporter substrate-binding protein [Jeotgalibacillus soli]|uniref:ABC transporter substrate-binding protein n=1 Tax=Jeotgalibacillus soli TaxID=889306 RepID=A0A0C2VRY5_9BACL|nr:BMP family ABC transporter substrate-binding protein [Jeotgalibacillus soli]KIL47206.1 ABC transporter substrate-binding protein [Jeotgalibacillus soli]
MKKLSALIAAIMMAFMLAGCSLFSEEQPQGTQFDAKIGILLSDTGLGDGSFNDAAFQGLERARTDLNIVFDYREAPEGNYEEMLNELVEQDMTLIIGLGFSVQEAIEKVALENPEQQFLLIDGYSEVANVVSVTFKEQEGSFLVGVVAALTSESGVIGFIGGVDAPVIHRFEQGYIAGAKFANPTITVLSNYAGDFGDTALGGNIAQQQIDQNADFIYPAAGYTGVGAILKAQEHGVFAAGVDSDQFFIAEEAVVTSMLKKIDVVVYDLVSSLVQGNIDEAAFELGLAEDGVGLAEIRLAQLDATGQALLQDVQKKIISGEIVVPETKE